MHGFGRFINSNGDYFIGNFQSGKKHGEGKFFTSKNEKKQEGKWINDRFEGELMNKSPSRRLT